ncbi:MAG: dephospho-CoA kinase [Zymomonas mobilis]|uniref:Dephospho-CoA kinase n=1 Tax=Zymomonas mobilis TaxID=542 RepID=A0A542VZ55_ZYMMB|nr:dephospho-CoA kinase [Zymomonas mobilis]TQL16573.1 dephospho-CoA kinase [Zymomonas mobilis]
MIILGLTGSIAMGKSTVARLFSRMRLPVFDADKVVHQLQAPNGQLLPAIGQAFPGVIDEKGVNRQKLGALLLQNPAGFRLLEAIIHPAVVEELQLFLRKNRSQPLVIVDIPLLFEAGFDRSVDYIAVVSAPHWIQKRRALARPNMTESRFYGLLARQWPDRKKRQHADFIIENGRNIIALAAQVRQITGCLVGQGSR